MPKKEILLAEYQIAQSEIERLDKQFWQAAQVFIPLSIAGLGYFASLEKHSIQSLTTVAIVGSGSSIILWAWYRIVNRWWVYQDVVRYRMKEIESELGLWLRKYANYISKVSRHQNPFDGNVPKEEKQRYEMISQKVSIALKGKPTHSYIRLMVLIVIFGWLLLIMREALLTLVI